MLLLRLAFVTKRLAQAKQDASIMSRPSIFVFLVPLMLGGALVLTAPGCGRQGEGERCDVANGTKGEDSDCADGLFCKSSQLLEHGNTSVCCPEDGTFTDVGCIPKSAGNTGDGGSGGTTMSSSGSGGGSAGNGGSTGGGAAKGGGGSGG